MLGRPTPAQPVALDRHKVQRVWDALRVRIKLLRLAAMPYFIERCTVLFDGVEQWGDARTITLAVQVGIVIREFRAENFTNCKLMLRAAVAGRWQQQLLKLQQPQPEK